ncbi:hypothetical protein QQ045_007354 [Rhodiola kirilowii]
MRLTSHNTICWKGDVATSDAAHALQIWCSSLNIKVERAIVGISEVPTPDLRAIDAEPRTSNRNAQLEVKRASQTEGLDKAKAHEKENEVPAQHEAKSSNSNGNGGKISSFNGRALLNFSSRYYLNSGVKRHEGEQLWHIGY